MVKVQLIMHDRRHTESIEMLYPFRACLKALTRRSLDAAELNWRYVSYSLSVPFVQIEAAA